MPLKAWLERDGSLLRLRLARPKANLIDAAMVAALQAAFQAHVANRGLLAVLIDHEGPNFSYGASVEEHLPGQYGAMLESLHAAIGAMLESPRPVFVAVRGQCLGGGLEVALAANFLFLAPDAKLGQPEMKLGVFAPAASVLLPQRIGQARAEDLLFSGRSIDAGTALAWGLATELAQDPAAAAAAYFDAHLAGKSGAALALAIRAARAPFARQARERLSQVEALYGEHLMATRDANEGLKAFIEKRQPKWEHR